MDNAGKTSLLYALEGRREEAAAPSWGFTAADVARDGLDLRVYDLGGGERIRGIWAEYLPEAHGAVFVVDAADRGRLAEAGGVLRAALADSHLEGKPVLLFANKQDLPGALPPAELVRELGLAGAPGAAALQVRGGSARKGGDGGRAAGVREGLQWLQRQVAGRRRELGPRVEREAEAHREIERQRREERRRRVQAEKEKREAEREAEEGGGGRPEGGLEGGEGGGGDAGRGGSSPPPASTPSRPDPVVLDDPPQLDAVGPLSPRTPRSSVAFAQGGGGGGGGAPAAGAAAAGEARRPPPLEEDLLSPLPPADPAGGAGEASALLEVQVLEQELQQKLMGAAEGGGELAGGGDFASPLPGAVMGSP